MRTLLGLLSFTLVLAAVVTTVVAPLGATFRPHDLPELLRTGSMIINIDGDILHGPFIDERGEQYLEWQPNQGPTRVYSTRDCHVVLTLGRLVHRCLGRPDAVITIFSTLPDPLVEGIILNRGLQSFSWLLSDVPAGIARPSRAYWTRAAGRLGPRWSSLSLPGQSELPDGSWLVLRSEESTDGALRHALERYVDGRQTARTPIVVPELRISHALARSKDGLRLYFHAIGYASNVSSGYIELDPRTLERLDSPNRILSNVRRPVVRYALALGVVFFLLARSTRRRWLLGVWLLFALAACGFVGVPLYALYRGVPFFW